MSTVIESTGPPGPPTMAEGVEVLEAFRTAAAARHAAEVDLVESLGELVRAGVVESLEGLPVDLLLAVEQHYTTAERAMLLDAAEVLNAMPATMRLWREGHLSWSQVRAIVAQLRRYGRDLRAVVDGQLAASVELLDAMDPDQLDWAVADAIDRLRDPAEVETQEEVDQRESFVVFQLATDGRSKVYGELDARDTAIATNALDHRAARTDQAAKQAQEVKQAEDAEQSEQADRVTDGEQSEQTDRVKAGRDRDTATDERCEGRDVPHGAASAWRRRRTRAKQRARALIDLCADSLAGTRSDGTPRPARPTMVVHVPLAAISRSSAGVLEVAVPRMLPRLSAATVEALARDADARAVVFDGKRPLCVTGKVDATTVPLETRLAVAARDLGGRDPGATTTVPLSHVHHLNGDRRHHPDELVTVSPRGHLRVLHRYGWSGRIDRDGRAHWTRGDRTITTLPRDTRLNEPG